MPRPRSRLVAPTPVSVLVGILLLFLAPGYLLLEALFPGRRYFGPFHPFALPALSVAVSAAIVVVVGSILGFLGRFEGAQTGAPVLELTLAAICVVLFAVAWARGAFPLLGRRAEYDNVAERGEPEDVTILRDLRLEEERLRKEAARVRGRGRDSRDAGVRGALIDAAEELERERKEVALRARELERKAGERRYGGPAKPRWRS